MHIEKIMNRFFTLLLAASCLTAVGQNNCDLVYDGTGDGAVGTDDLIGLLTEYGIICNQPGISQCGDPLSYQGYDYATVLIGEQCWFAENLRNENYENGDPIPATLSDNEWTSTDAGALSVYGEDAGCENLSPDINACNPSEALDEYGRLYNFFAVVDARGLCPSGWHIPSDEEWTVMTDGLGGVFAAGGEMKTTYGWRDGGNGTNSSGFSGLPGGLRWNNYLSNGNFYNGGELGYWWSSTPGGEGGYGRDILYSQVDVHRNAYDANLGFSVRCILDAE
jgi:uncharacterized protein (TIGR02145 family)